MYSLSSEFFAVATFFLRSSGMVFLFKGDPISLSLKSNGLCMTTKVCYLRDQLLRQIGIAFENGEKHVEK